MGLELGPPWLVALIDDGRTVEVIYRDNFTGAGFERVRTVVRDEVGAVSAVLGKNGALGRHADGSLFQPLVEMRGRNFGTPSERGHRAYLIACDLLNETPFPFTRPISKREMRIKFWKWVGLIIVFIVSWALFARIFGRK